MNEDILIPDKTSIFPLSTNAITLFRSKDGHTVLAAMECRINLCFEVTWNEVPVDIVFDLCNALVSETARYNARIWCHYIGFSLKIRIDNFYKEDYACTWGWVFHQVMQIMASVGMDKITNSEIIRKFHALFRIQEQFPLLWKEKYHLPYLPQDNSDIAENIKMYD